MVVAETVFTFLIFIVFTFMLSDWSFKNEEK